MAVNGTTYSQRRAIREQAERELSGKTTTPSARAFIRGRIPILRRQQEDGVPAKKNGETANIRSPIGTFGEPKRKTFGGIPSQARDNPQRLATQAGYGKEARQAELDDKVDRELAQILGTHMKGSFGMALRDRDFDKYLNMKHYSLYEDPSFLSSERRKIIKVILEAEFSDTQENEESAIEEGSLPTQSTVSTSEGRNTRLQSAPPKEMRRRELNLLRDRDLKTALNSVLEGDAGADLQVRHRDFLFSLVMPYMTSEQTMIIDIILEAEFPEKPHPSSAPNETTPRETLRTDEPFLSTLNNVALVEHAKKLVGSKAFKSRAAPLSYDRLALLARTTVPDSLGVLYPWEREDLKSAIGAAADTSVHGRRLSPIL